MALRVTTSGGSLRTPREVVGNFIRIGGHPSSEVSLPGLGERVLLLFASRQGVHGRRLDEANLRKRFDAVEELRFTIGPYRIIAKREGVTDDRGPLRSNLFPTVVIEGRSRKEAKLSRPITLIGRSELSDIALRHRGVSRVHAALLWDGAELTVVDLFSANGTQVDGSKTDYVPLSHGQVLTVDDVKLRVRTPGRELTSDLPPEAPTTDAVPTIDPLVEAKAQDLPGENPLEAVAPADEAIEPYREAQPDPATERTAKGELEALETQPPGRASEPFADELSIDWELAADLESHATLSLPDAETSGEITSDEPGLDKVAAESNRIAEDKSFAEPIGVDDAWAPLEAPQSDAAPPAETELWEDLLAADFNEDASLSAGDAVDVVAERISEPEPSDLVEQQPSSAIELGGDELTIDWEPALDLESPDAASPPGPEPLADLSIDGPEPDDIGTDLNHSGQEEIPAEQIESDPGLAPPEPRAGDTAPQAEAEPWEDLLAGDLHEDSMLRAVDDDASTGEFYDDLPVFHGDPRNETVANESAVDEQLADAADSVEVDDFTYLDELRKGDFVSDDPAAPGLTAGDRTAGAPSQTDAATNAFEPELSEPSQAGLPTELPNADLDPADLSIAESNDPDSIDNDLIDTELKDSEGSNYQLTPQLPLDPDAIDFADTIEPDGLAPKGAASIEEPLAIMDDEQLLSDFGGVRSTDLGADSTDVGLDIDEMLESPDVEREAFAPTGDASQEQAFKGPKRFRPEVTEPTVDYMAHLTRFHERDSMSLTRKVLLSLAASAIVAILGVLGYWAYSTFLSA